MSQTTHDDSRGRLSVGYLLTVVGLMAVAPGISIVVEALRGSGESLPGIAFRWFVFWAVGLRLLTAGIRQIVQPRFTAREIFHLESPDAEVIVRELGFANACLGLTAVASGVWRMPAAFAGGLYFGIAGVMHVVKRPSTPNEWIALVSDLAVVVLLGGLASRLVG